MTTRITKTAAGLLALETAEVKSIADGVAELVVRKGPPPKQRFLRSKVERYDQCPRCGASAGVLVRLETPVGVFECKRSKSPRLRGCGREYYGPPFQPQMKRKGVRASAETCRAFGQRPPGPGGNR